MRNLDRRTLTVGDIVIRFIIFLLAAIILMGLQITGRLTPIQSTITDITSSPQEVFTSVSDSIAGWIGSAQRLRTLGSENNQLTAQNAELRARIVKLEEQLIEYNWMREQLNFAETNPDVLLSGAQIVARRIGQESSNFRSFLLVDLGTEHGVAVGMPVITNAGLVGRIFEVNRTTSKVLLITDPNSQVNSMLSKERISGITQGNPGGTLSLEFIQDGPPIAVGGTVLTSGSSIAQSNTEETDRRFPKGIPIGTIVEVIDSDELLSRRAIIEPFVSFERLELLLIITNFDSLDEDVDFGELEAPLPDDGAAGDTEAVDPAVEETQGN